MKNAFIALHISILLAGWTGVFGKLIDLTPQMIVWWRIVIGGTVLIAWISYFHQWQKCSRQEIIKYFFLGVVLAYQWMLFYAAIKVSNVSIAVVAFSTLGFFTALFEPLINRVRISVREIAISLLTIAGVALIFHFDSRYRLGLTFGLLTAAGAALIAIYMKSFRRQHNVQTVLGWQFIGAFFGASLLLPFNFWLMPQTQFFPTLWPDVLYILIFSTVITLGMYVLQMVALKHVSAFTVNLSYNLEPIYSILIAMVLFDEGQELNASFWAGLSLIALSVVLQSLCVLHQARRSPAADAPQQ